MASKSKKKNNTIQQTHSIINCLSKSAVTVKVKFVGDDVETSTKSRWVVSRLPSDDTL